MLYELCSFAAAFITDRNQASERGGPTSLGEQRRKRSEEEEKVGSSRSTASYPLLMHAIHRRQPQTLK
jgi:hypothetical protein